MEYSLLIFFIAGALGALIKDVLEDNELKLPKITDGKFCLGFLGGCAIGGISGYLADGSPEVAFLAGYTGKSVIENLIAKNSGVEIPKEKIMEGLIRKVAKEECVDPDLAVRVAKCESLLDYKAKSVNTDGSTDRGLFQINNKYHPEISDEIAYNPIEATRFFCKSFKYGHLDWWSATKKCWSLDKLS